MNTDEKLALIHKHLDAEGAGDIETACSVYAEDIEHDAVGFPGSPCFGIDAAKAFYGHLTANVRTTGEKPLHQYETTDGAVVVEAEMSADVIGEFLGIPGNDRNITFRILHVFEFDDSLITREQVWLDTGAIVAQLTAHEESTL
ncbi:MAG: nuclear transport factor 2 family protein [Ilumatobacteraceae bacterium]